MPATFVENSSNSLVWVLVQGRREARHYEELWEGTDAHGRSVASGVYFYRLKAGNDVLTRKAVFLK